MKLYTRRGDAGETDLLGGGRVAKDHRRVEAYGAVDELNSCLGAAAAASPHEDVRALCREIQSALLDLGAQLATPEARHRTGTGAPELTDTHVAALESRIDALDRELEPLAGFVLPGGTPAASAFHVARSVCRRAERRAVALGGAEPIPPESLRYLNRLSDLLFVLARLENRRAGAGDVAWRGRER